MKENFVMGTSKYPKSLEAVLPILNAYQPPAGWNKCRQEAVTRSKEGAIFAQAKGGDNSWKLRQDCFKCGKRGHIARECPEKKGSKSRCTQMLSRCRNGRRGPRPRGEHLHAEERRRS